MQNSPTLDPTPRSLTLTGNINAVGGRTITNNLPAGATFTLGSAASPGTLTRNNTLTFQTQTGISGVGGGVMVINDAIVGSNSSITFQNGVNATLNNTISGNGNLVAQAAGTVVHFNKTGMYTGTGTLTVQSGAVAYFDQPTAYAGSGTFTTNGAGSTSYINSELDVTGTFAIEANSVVYVNAPTTYSSPVTQAMNVQFARATPNRVGREQYSYVIGAATSPVRVATGTLAGNNGTILGRSRFWFPATDLPISLRAVPYPPVARTQRPAIKTAPATHDRKSVESVRSQFQRHLALRYVQLLRRDRRHHAGHGFRSSCGQRQLGNRH